MGPVVSTPGTTSRSYANSEAVLLADARDQLNQARVIVLDVTDPRVYRPAYHPCGMAGEWLGIGSEAATPQIGAADPRSPAALRETQDAHSRIVAGRSVGPDGSDSGTFSSAGIELGTGNVGSGAWRDPGGRRPWLELALSAWWWTASPVFGRAPF